MRGAADAAAPELALDDRGAAAERRRVDPLLRARPHARRRAPVEVAGRRDGPVRRRRLVENVRGPAAAAAGPRAVQHPHDPGVDGPRPLEGGPQVRSRGGGDHRGREPQPHCLNLV